MREKVAPPHGKVAPPCRKVAPPCEKVAPPRRKVATPHEKGSPLQQRRTPISPGIALPAAAAASLRAACGRLSRSARLPNPRPLQICNPQSAIRNSPPPARPTTSCPSRLRGSSPCAQSPETERPPATRKRTPSLRQPTRIWKCAVTSAHITARPPRNALVEYIKRFYLRQRAQSATSSFGNGTRSARATFPSTMNEGTDRPVSIRPTISLDNPEAISTSYIVNPRASRSTRNRFTILRKTRSAYSCASRHRLNFASARAFASARLCRVDSNLCMGKKRTLLPHSFKNLSENDALLRRMVAPVGMATSRATLRHEGVTPPPLHYHPICPGREELRRCCPRHP